MLLITSRQFPLVDEKDVWDVMAVGPICLLANIPTRGFEILERREQDMPPGVVGHEGYAAQLPIIGPS